MAMSTGNGGSNDKAFFAKIQGLKKGSKELYFEVKTKEDGELVVIKEKPTKIEGYLEKIEMRKFEYDGKVHDDIKLIMKDNGEVYFISVGLNSMSRNIFNSLATVELFGKIAISVYFNKKGFPTSFITNDGAKTPWKYTFEELNAKVEDIKNSKGEVLQRDYSELDRFYLETVIPAIQAKLVTNDGSGYVADTLAEGNDFSVENPDNDSLPF